MKISFGLAINYSVGILVSVMCIVIGATLAEAFMTTLCIILGTGQAFWALFSMCSRYDLYRYIRGSLIFWIYGLIVLILYFPGVLTSINILNFMSLLALMASVTGLMVMYLYDIIEGYR